MNKFFARLKEEAKKIFSIEASPHSVALGAAIGVLFGITPLIGIKMPLAVALSFMLRGNVAATLVVVGLMDLIVPVMAVVYVFEYKLGCFLFAMKEHAASINLIDDPGEVPQWVGIVSKAKPLLMGSIVLGVLAALPSYSIVKAVLNKRNAKKGR